jgi:hypothetical protein
MYQLNRVDMHDALKQHGYKYLESREYTQKQKNLKSNLVRIGNNGMSQEHYRYQRDKADKKLVHQLHMYHQNKVYIQKQYDLKRIPDYMEDIV